MSTALPAIFSSFSHHKLILVPKTKLLARLYHAGMTSRESQRRSKNVRYTWTAPGRSETTHLRNRSMIYIINERISILEIWSWIMDKITPAARLRMVQISRNLNQKPSPSMLFDSTRQFFTEKKKSDSLLCMCLEGNDLRTSSLILTQIGQSKSSYQHWTWHCFARPSPARFGARSHGKRCKV